MKKRAIVIILILLALARAAPAQQKSNLTASSTNCVTANSCVSVAVDPPQGGATFTLSGTFSATVQFEASGDGGATWVALSVTPSNSTTAVTSATGSGTWQANVAAYTNIRERVSTYTSGTVVASIIESTASARAGGGGGAGGTAINATNNTLPKRSNATTFVDSALSDNATNVISTDAILVPNGSAASPAYATTGDANTGMYFDGFHDVFIGTNGVERLLVNSVAVRADQALSSLVSVQGPLYLTSANCSSGVSPAVCGAAAAGSVAVPAGAAVALQVNTTAVTANSQIIIVSDETLGTKLSVTCNTTLASAAVEPVITARNPGVSFTVTIVGTTVTNPVCLSYFIVN